MADAPRHDHDLTKEELRQARVRSIAIALRNGARDLAAALEMVRVLLDAEVMAQRRARKP